MLLVYNLPDEILQLIQTLSTNNDYHYFLNTSKQHLSRWKKQSIYFKLNSTRSLQYINDLIFRELLLGKVLNGWKQISVIFRNEEDDKVPSYLSLFSKSVMPLIPEDLPIHQIRSPDENKNRIWNMKNNLNNSESVACIEFTGVAIPPIPKVKELYLCKCEQLTDVSNLRHLEQVTVKESSQLEDISPLSNIPKITFFNVDEASDFSIFNCNHQSYLEIINCKKLSNIDSFRMIRKLKLSNCPNITDVSCLYGIHDLTLWALPKVKDISGLGGHHRISLGVGDVAGYECLYNIPHVSLSANLTDITMLRNAKTVQLTGFNDLEDVSPLANAIEVSFYLCFRNGIKSVDISSLRNVQRLKLIKSPYLYSHEKMQNQFVKVHIDFTLLEVITDLRPFLHVPNLFLTLTSSSEEQLKAYEYLLSSRNLQSLTLERCKVGNYDVLGDIPQVTLRYLDTKDISCLGRKNRYVKLHMCYKVEDVSSLKNVPVVTIRDKEFRSISKCSKIESIKSTEIRVFLHSHTFAFSSHFYIF